MILIPNGFHQNYNIVSDVHVIDKATHTSHSPMVCIIQIQEDKILLLPKPFILCDYERIT